MARLKNPVDCAKLTQDLNDARVVSAEAVKGVIKGGTCNFDHPVIRLPLTRSKRVNAEIKAAIEAAGIHPSSAYGVYKGYTSLYGFPGSNAQGATATVSAEAVAKFLKARGWNASVLYAID